MAPDILWIITTQWRAQATGYAGDAQARTPSLDRLATESRNYTEAVTPHPFGPFARAALLTGRLSPDNGVIEYYDPLPSGARTVAHELAALGYTTAYFGKWHLAARDRTAPLVGEVHARMRVPPEGRGGFAFWEGFESGFLLNDPWLHGSRLPEPVQFSGYQSDVVCARAAAWLAARGAHTVAGGLGGADEGGRTGEGGERRLGDEGAAGRVPVFMIVSLEAPHPPYAAALPAGIVAPEPGALRLPPNVPTGGALEARVRAELAGYYGHIEATDRAVGRLLAAVPSSTAVVFTSVHGDMHGAHGLLRKGWPYEESVRVPLLVRGPAGAVGEPGNVETAVAWAGVSREPVSLVDLPDLTLALAQGRTWCCPVERAAISMPSVVQLPHQCGRRWHGWRTPERKRVWLEDGSLWLDFDLRADPWERVNLAR